MGINLISDVVLQQFANSAKRFGAAAETALAAHGDELLDGRQAFVPDILALRTRFGDLQVSYRHVLRDAPSVVGELPSTLREEMASALRAAEAASDTWHRETGSATLASFAALADAARGVADIAAKGAPAERPIRVVVGGGGAAGLSVASLLREAGADVRLIAPVEQARTGSVMIDRRGWHILERVGGSKIVANAPIDDTGNYRMAGLQRIERDLAKHADDIGVRREHAYAIHGAEQLDDGVRIQLRHVNGAERHPTIDADWYVDATGGSSPVARSDAFRRDLFHGPYGALPAERTFIAASARAVPERDLGWTAPDGSFAINDVHEGVVTAYRGLDGVTKPVAVSTTEATELLRALDVDPTTIIGEPWSFVARQTLARSAGAGRVLIVGDGAGTVQPVTQAGVYLALTDAERAAKTIIGARSVTREAIRDAVAAYDEQSRVVGSAGTSGSDLLERIANDASEVATEATERATRTHDEQTRAMHRVFLA